MDELDRLKAEVKRLREETARLMSTLAMTVGRLGGEVEGHETARHNFLQRIDALRLMEEEVHHAHAAMARDADVISQLRAEVERLREENADLRTEMEVRRVATKARIDELHAHVAALVKRLTDILFHFSPDFLDRTSESDCGWRAKELLDAPDLAALVARAEKERAVIAAVDALYEVVVERDGLIVPPKHWGDRGREAARVLIRAAENLRALDNEGAKGWMILK